MARRVCIKTYDRPLQRDPAQGQEPRSPGAPPRRCRATAEKPLARGPSPGARLGAHECRRDGIQDPGGDGGQELGDLGGVSITGREGLKGLLRTGPGVARAERDASRRSADDRGGLDGHGRADLAAGPPGSHVWAAVRSPLPPPPVEPSVALSVAMRARRSTCQRRRRVAWEAERSMPSESHLRSTGRLSSTSLASLAANTVACTHSKPS